MYGIFQMSPPDAFLAEHRPDPDLQRWPERARRHHALPDRLAGLIQHPLTRETARGFCFHAAPQGRHLRSSAWTGLDRVVAPHCGVTAGLRSGIGLDQAHPVV
jgi:hypothetical protein